MRFLWGLCVFCAVALEAHALDREAFRFTKYDLNVRIEPEQQRLGVRGKITLRNHSSIPQKNASLQISSTLDWRSIKVAGAPVQFVSQPYTSDIDHTGILSEAIVSLPEEVAPNATVELEIGYEGTIPLDATRLTRIGVPEQQAKHSDWDQINKSYSAVRGIGYVAWYPVAVEAASLSEGNSVFEAVEKWKQREKQSQMDVTLEYPSLPAASNAPEMLCNGREQRGMARGGSPPKFPWAQCRYASLDLSIPWFGVANYERLETQAAIVHYISNHKSEAADYALAADLALPFVTEWFGVPSLKAEVVELADPMAAPFESRTILMSPLNGRDSRMDQLSSVHQLTHAAFTSPRLWIYEGLAHFAQAEYQERQNGRQSAIDFMTAHRPALADAETALAREHDASVSAQESLINTSREELYRSKAMYVWWMLRDMVGEEKLKKALAQYRPDQDKEPAYIERLIEAQSKRDLEWFFDDWVYRDRALPQFQLESVYPRPTVGGGYVVTLTIDNSGEAGAEVPVILRMDNGELTKRLEVRAKSKSSIRIEAASWPREAVVNDGSVPESGLANHRFRIQKP
jgi:hypothetical protein